MTKSRGFALAEIELTSFDRSFTTRCHVQRPDRYRLIEALPPDVQRITRGSGVSYGGASFGGDGVVQEMSAFNRILDFDAEKGLLTVEAGACIGDVVRFALARGWILPVVPGHPRASIGGCIAADVHGKNPARDGSFREHVESLELFDVGQGWIAANRHENSDRFAACFAGFGIAGLIGSATLRLAPAPDAYTIRRISVASLSEAGEVLLAHASAPLLYGWHDGRAGKFGRGVIRFGLEAQMPKSANSPLADLPVAVKPWPYVAWNKLGIAAMNSWIQHRWCAAGSDLVVVETAMFPLNAARSYFAGFGREGMFEAQWLIPHKRYMDFVRSLEALVKRMQPRISLIASKLFDSEPQGLSFDGRGIALAIQLPQPKLSPQSSFIKAMTELAIEHEARPNLIKDSTLDALNVRRAIPDFEAAKMCLRAFDPQHLQRSELTKRLDL